MNKKLLIKLSMLVSVFLNCVGTVSFAQQVEPSAFRACSKPCPGKTKPARQLNILLINDDSITENVIALYSGLVDAGHNVYAFLLACAAVFGNSLLYY